ncbi:sensor histidine kinase [Paractinoplanes toevensis]|uniref:histidine kinase n=1 Tax=Paractinoplanes toevensis TaxID=571911 RepID=A0A919T4T1_9ACTN|nr:histidine kinase [Actinoplanes toevensis]GIM88377.1 two-component sensor histidine kinase [Actinoplanes toevensis]
MNGVRDVVAVGGALGLGALLVVVGDPTGEVPGLVPWQADVAVGVLACFGLVLRRRWPLGLAAVVVPLSAVSVMASGAVLGAVFGLALRRTFLVALGFALGYLATIPVYLLMQPDPRHSLWTDLVVRGVLVSAAVGWGLYARERQALIDHLGERADRAEAEQAARIAGARRDERDRIAREMHDVLAHRLSMISLQAGALELHPALPAEVHLAAGVVQTGAHEALDELRSVIGVLRDEPEPPQPGLAEVRDLVADAHRCGSEVDFDDRLATAPPGAAGRVAYRVVQEALTNARKHAPGRPVRLVLDGGPGEGLRISVSNPFSVRSGSVPGSGLGLVGVAERVELAGGRLVRDTVDGWFRLEVLLPWLA